MTKVRHNSRHSMTVNEERVMSLYDSGLRSREIASRTGVSEANVRTIISRFISDDTRVRERAIRDATKELGTKCAALRARMAS